MTARTGPYRHPDPAVRKEMWRIVRERQQRPSHLMDYGDWPPAPARPAPERVDWAAVRRRAIELVIMWALIADLGLVIIAIRGERPMQMSFPSDVTATSVPHPATTGSHP